MEPLLKIEDLHVSFETTGHEQPVLRGVDLSMDRGKIVALVGESGCGKTVLCKTLLQILCSKGRIRQGRIFLDGEDLLLRSESEMEQRRGQEISMVFQDPFTSLDPVVSVGNQIAEVLRLQGGLSRKAAKEKAVRLMGQVGIDRAEQRYYQMPHHFSGGMRQRAGIAIALAGDPKLLLADEPTTSLDPEIQKQILHLLQEIRKELRLSILFITHDLSLVEGFADRVAIMEAGRIVEMGLVEEVFRRPRQEYTKRLLRYLDYGKGRGHTHGDIHFHDGKAHSHRHGPGHAQEHIHSLKQDCESAGCRDSCPDSGRVFPVEPGFSQGREKWIEVRGLCKDFKLHGKTAVRVLDHLDLDIYRGEVLGIIGPSGRGKSTLAKCLMGLEQPAAGEIRYLGENLKGNGRIRRQMIFQDSAAAFNPRKTLGESIGEPLRILRGRKPERQEIFELMDQAELSRQLADKYPYEVSGGQRQRAAIARAISTDPELLIADEPISSLDVSIQAQIIHLFKKLQRERGLTLVLIAHDLPMVQHISDRIIEL